MAHSSLAYSMAALTITILLSVSVQFIFPSLAAGPVRYISEEELKKFVENLLENDVNNAGGLVTLNLQARSPYNSTEDLAPDVLLKVDPKAYKLPTVSLLARFYDNYIPDALKNEEVTAEEIKEEETFMNTIASTRIMTLTRTFLSSKEHSNYGYDRGKLAGSMHTPRQATRWAGGRLLLLRRRYGSRTTNKFLEVDPAPTFIKLPKDSVETRSIPAGGLAGCHMGGMWGSTSQTEVVW